MIFCKLPGFIVLMKKNIKLFFLVFSLSILSACTIFPGPVEEEMKEDPDPKTNNFL